MTLPPGPYWEAPAFDRNEGRAQGWDQFERMVTEHSRRVRAAMDQACELALQTGVCGVLVTYGPMEEHENKLSFGATIQVTPDVPYGTIEERHQ